MEVEIDIKLSKKKSSPAQKQRGPLNRRRKKDDGRRRLTSAGVQVFDMGQTLEGGVWTTISRTHNLAPYYSGYTLMMGSPLTSARLRELESYVLGLPRSKFRPISKTDVPGGETSVGHDSYYTQTSDKWQGTFIKLDAADIATGIAVNVLQHLFNAFLDTNGGANTKVTATYDPNGTSIPITVSTKAKVYVMPKLVLMEGAYAPGGFLDIVHLGFNYVVLPRIWDRYAPYITDSDHAGIVESIAIAKSISGIKAYKYDWDGHAIDDIYEVPLSTMPDSGDDLAMSYSVDTFSDLNPGYLDWYLTGLIEQSGVTYYVWGKD